MTSKLLFIPLLETELPPIQSNLPWSLFITSHIKFQDYSSCGTILSLLSLKIHLLDACFHCIPLSRGVPSIVLLLPSVFVLFLPLLRSVPHWGNFSVLLVEVDWGVR